MMALVESHQDSITLSLVYTRQLTVSSRVSLNLIKADRYVKRCPAMFGIRRASRNRSSPLPIIIFSSQYRRPRGISQLLFRLNSVKRWDHSPGAFWRNNPHGSPRTTPTALPVLFGQDLS